MNLACDAVIATLDQFTRDDILVEIGMDDPLTFRDVADLARGVGGYVFRETFAAFMQSATIAQGFERPRGHAEGRDFLEKVEQAEPDGDGRFGPLIDRWFLGRPLCQARRNSVRRIMALLQQAAAAAPGQGPARLTSLSAGTCQEVLTLLTSPSRPLYLTCIDADADDLTAAADSAGQQNCADHITFLEADLLDMIDGVGPISLGPQHVIYGLGVCDYLTDDQVKTLLDWAHGLLVAGGWVIVTNREAASPDRAFVEIGRASCRERV